MGVSFCLIFFLACWLEIKVSLVITSRLTNSAVNVKFFISKHFHKFFHRSDHSNFYKLELFIDSFEFCL